MNQMDGRKKKERKKANRRTHIRRVFRIALEDTTFMSISFATTLTSGWKAREQELLETITKAIFIDDKVNEKTHWSRSISANYDLSIFRYFPRSNITSTLDSWNFISKNTLDFQHRSFLYTHAHYFLLIKRLRTLRSFVIIFLSNELISFDFDCNDDHSTHGNFIRLHFLDFTLLFVRW